MRGIYGLSNYASLFGSGTTSYSNMFGSSSASSFYSNLSEYSSIQSGAYRKLVKSYYKKMGQTDTEQTNKTNTTTTRKTTNAQNVSANKVALSTVKAESTELVNTTAKLINTGKDSLFANADKYDKDAAYKAVGAFVSDYNATVDALKSVSDISVQSAGSSMQRITSIMSKGLSKIGITVGSDGKLSLDEKSFKDADISNVKSMFNGTGSYAGIVSASASRVSSQAANQINRSNGSLYGSQYGNQGYYYNSYNSGLLYNGYF